MLIYGREVLKERFFVQILLVSIIALFCLDFEVRNSMAESYASALSPCPNKGVVGLPEVRWFCSVFCCGFHVSSCHFGSFALGFEECVCGLSPQIPDEASVVEAKVLKLLQFLREAKHTVVHTGAGISTAAGSKASASDDSALLTSFALFCFSRRF